MVFGETRATWAAFKAAQREAGSEIVGSEHVLCLDGVGSEHLLVGLLIDERELIARMLKQHGITVEDVRRALHEKPPDAGTDDVRQLCVGADAAASAMEHVAREPGHLFLAIAQDRTCAGHQILRDLGVDVDGVAKRVVERLPTLVRDEAFYRELVERYPRLPRAQVQQLVREVLAWRAAIRALRDDRSLTAKEERRLRHVLEETKSSWLTLVQHHNYLVFDHALPCAAEGHNLDYAWRVAAGGLNSLVLAEEPAADVDFEEQARARIAAELHDRLACEPPVRHRGPP